MDVSLNKPLKGHVHNEWLSFIEKSITELEKQQDSDSNDELSDDPFASSDEDESSARDEIQQLLSRKPAQKPVVIKPASRQSIIRLGGISMAEDWTTTRHGCKIFCRHSNSTRPKWEKEWQCQQC